MKLISSLKVLVLSTLITLFAHFAYAEDSANFQLLPGDKLAISVWGEDTLNIKDVMVLPDGSISFPLVGTVQVKNLTSSQVSTLLVEKLKEFLPEPQVTVVVTGVDGHRAYVVGKVSNPGPVLLSSGMTVLQALSMAGILDKFANEDAIKLIRNGKDGQQVFSIKYNELLKGKQLDSNLLLLPGDTIVVP